MILIVTEILLVKMYSMSIVLNVYKLYLLSFSAYYLLIVVFGHLKHFLFSTETLKKRWYFFRADILKTDFLFYFEGLKHWSYVPL